MPLISLGPAASEVTQEQLADSHRPILSSRLDRRMETVMKNKTELIKLGHIQQQILSQMLQCQKPPFACTMSDS